jgi:luciferase family oxidoreductase group 1
VRVPDTQLPPLSILDLAPIVEGGSAAESLRNSLDLAQHAERWGYKRFWLAEHHNSSGIASAATAVVVAHVAAGTSTIRVGAGGIMLPNHSPLVIAEQFGTLEALHPGRIDLGLGRAPGTDVPTMLALRRNDHPGSDTFPQDVLELQMYLGDLQPGQTVRAIPGVGSKVPLWILGSSLYGAQLAAALGLPYAFASHFAPAALHQAIQVYREDFRPSAQLEQPFVMVGVNVIAADTDADAQAMFQKSRRARVKNLFSRGEERLTDDEVEAVLASPQAAAVDQMLVYSAVGTPDAVVAYLDDFQETTGADELMTVHHADTVARRLRSVELLADAAGLAERAGAGSPVP